MGDGINDAPALKAADVGISVAIVSPLASTLGFVPLPPLCWLLLALMLPCYVVLTQSMKTWLYRRCGE